MTAELQLQPIDPEEARLAARKKGLGSSDTPKILGCDGAFGTALDVWADKLNLVPREPENEFMKWGKLLEPAIAQEYMSKTGRVLVRPGMKRHPKYDWMIASLDRVVQREPLAVELKNAGWGGKWGEPGTEDVPDAYYAQIQHQLAVTGFQRIDCAVLIGGNRFAIYPIERNEEAIAALIEALHEFWTNHVLTGIPPATDGSESCRNYLTARYPKQVEGSEMMATNELARLVAELAEARFALKQAEESERENANAIKAAMGEIETLVGDGFKITWKARQGNRFVDYEAISKALAQRLGLGSAEWDRIVNAHEGRTAPTRVFLPKWEKGSRT